MKIEVRNISIASLITSSVPLVLFALAVLGGLVQFVFTENPQIAPMSATDKMLSVGFFSLLYVVIASALLVFMSFTYNILTGVLGMKGISFDLEEITGNNE